MWLRAIDIRIISGDKEKILKDVAVKGKIEFTPMENGSGLLLLPIDVLIERNIEAAHRGIPEYPALSKFDLQLRTILNLTKKEAHALLITKPGRITFKRKGWGQEFVHVIEKFS